MNSCYHTHSSFLKLSPFLHHCRRRLLQQPPLFLDQMSFSLIRLVVLFLVLDLCVHTALSHSSWRVIRGCSHSHDHDHHHEAANMMKLPEELAEEDMKLCGFGPCLHLHHESSSSLSGFALWVNALECSLLVSLASLVCLILLPVMFVQGKPAK